MQVSYGVLTNQGGRPVNEDSVGAFADKDDSKCFIVCDGLGGHGMGDVASSLVVNSFKESLEGGSEEKPEVYDGVSFLSKAFDKAQEELLMDQVTRHAQHQMKTTAAVLFLQGNSAYIGHVGDSRVYWFHRGKVKRRTLDHSIPQMLALTKDIKEKEIRNHPQRSYVLRVMGVKWEEPQYELEKPIKLGKHDTFLLCSDGFWELIEENDMQALLKKAESPDAWLKSMEERVKVNGEGREMDNYSAIAVWCS